MKPIRVLLIDDQRTVRNALRMLFAGQPDIEVLGEASDGACVLAKVRALCPDVLVMDYELQGMNGVQAMEALSAAGERCATVMLSLHDDAATRRHAALAGVHAFVTKHEAPQVLLAAIRSAAATMTGSEDTS
jgi:DNA-binding NarL/FixJ family response regulator